MCFASNIFAINVAGDFIFYFLLFLINHYSYSGTITYDERLHPPQRSEGVIQPRSQSLLTTHLVT